MIYRTMLKSKIHRATVTEANIDYEGSITIDAEIMEAADILNHELVHVLDLTNGHRLETYAITGESGSGEICINGAAARLINRGDTVIIVSYASVPDRLAAEYPAKVIMVDGKNQVTAVKDHGSAFNVC